MLRYVWWEFLYSVKKFRFVIAVFFMLYFSCVSMVQEEGVWRFQNVVQLFCIWLIFGDAFQYHMERTIPRVFFYVPRRSERGENGLQSYICLRCIVEIITFILLSLGVDGVAYLYHQIIRHRHIYLGVPIVQVMQLLLFVLCLTYFRVGAFHKVLLQRWMFVGRAELLHFIMVAVTILTFCFTEIVIDSAIGGVMPSSGEIIVLGVVVLFCLLHTLYFSYRCVREMCVAEDGVIKTERCCYYGRKSKL